MRKMFFLSYSSPKMNWVLAQIKKKEALLSYQPHLSPLLSPPPYSTSYQKDSSPSPQAPSGSKISPTVLFIIVILAVIFFISGLLHLLVRFLIKQPSSTSSSQSNRYPQVSGSDALQRQLQQLFHLHDSGLDQAFIDALPVFLYKEIMGLKEPFDCAVCLCEFLEDDKLRLLPICSHAFHLNCIDTWLLSNSTCPLCRGTLFAPGFAIENPMFDSNDSRDGDGLSGDGDDGFQSSQKVVEIEEIVSEKLVLPVRLGKFRTLDNEESGGGETSSSNLDARRCFSMGSYQYVVGDSNLQVAFCQDRDGNVEQLMNRRGSNGNFSSEVDVEGKKIFRGSKGESFSVSKIWLWSKKGKFPSISDTHSGISSLNVGLPPIERTQGI
ncbi:RING-H2 finger protein ATL46-like [Tasmannia lanceolata]|uniref:RING-H2 finger protein ATL46-like n=1 Tax=Tasmannia lanceolata TaxID=3420 RepID=UPI0040637A1B